MMTDSFCTVMNLLTSVYFYSLTVLTKADLTLYCEMTGLLSSYQPQCNVSTNRQEMTSCFICQYHWNILEAPVKKHQMTGRGSKKEQTPAFEPPTHTSSSAASYRMYGVKRKCESRLICQISHCYNQLKSLQRF